MFEHVFTELTEMNAVTTEKGRQYRTPEGINLPSITTVLSILSRESIAKWRARVGHEEANRISHRASTRGTSVHEIIEKYINNWITNYFMQESAYAIMWEERTKQPITQLVTIVSVDNHEPQIFIEHRDTWVRPLRETIAKYNAENSGNTLDI